MSKLLSVSVIMGCALAVAIALIFLCGSSKWAFKYLIWYRLLKHPAGREKDEVKITHDMAAIAISLAALVAAAALLIYGMPVVIEHLPEFDEMLFDISVMHEKGRNQLMLKTIILVPVIMTCATGGTIGLIKLIKKFAPNVELPDELVAKDLKDRAKEKD